MPCRVAERFCFLGVTAEKGRRSLGCQSLQIQNKKCLLPRNDKPKDAEKKSRQKCFFFVNYKCFFMAPPDQQFLNRQIYYCIQFAIYGVLRSAHHPASRGSSLLPFVLPAKQNCIKAFLARRTSYV